MNELITLAADLGRDACTWCIRTNASTCVLLLVAIVADLLLARRVSAAWRIFLYAPSLVRVLIPASATLSLPMPGSLAAPAAPMPDFTVLLVAPSTIASSITPPSPGTSPLFAAGAVVYLIVAAALGVRWVKEARAIRQTVHDASPSSLGPRVLISSHAGPMVVGVLKPRILVPKWLVDADTLPLILAHEHAHVARRDPFLAALLRLLCTIAWPILPVWIASARIRALMEQACDQRALSAHAACRQEVQLTYAQALIEVASRSTRGTWTLAFGGSLSSRILALRHAKRWHAMPQLLAIMSVATAMIGCAVVKPDTAQHPAEQPAMALTSEPATSQPQTSQPETSDPAPEATPRRRDSAYGLSVAAVDVVQPMVMLPVDEDFLVNVRIMDGDLALESIDPDGEAISVLDREQLEAALNANTSARVIAWPRVAVGVSQPAEVRMTLDDVGFVFNVVVYPSPEGTVIASVSYSEGSAYQIAPHTLRTKETDATIIRIPATDAATSRTLIITIERPKDDC